MNRRDFLRAATAAAVAPAIAAIPAEVLVGAGDGVYGTSPAAAALASLRELNAMRAQWLNHWNEMADFFLPGATT